MLGVEPRVPEWAENEISKGANLVVALIEMVVRAQLSGEVVRLDRSQIPQLVSLPEPECIGQLCWRGTES